MQDSPLDSTPNLSRLAFVVTLSVALVLGSQAFAGDGSQGGGRELTEQGKKWDADGDGRLDAKEKVKARATLLDRWDADGDGRLGPEERDQARAAGELAPPRPGQTRRREERARSAKQEMLRQQLDVNGDGKLGPEELSGVMAPGAAERAEARRRKNLAVHDADGDGVLNEEERRRARRAAGIVNRKEIEDMAAEIERERAEN